MTRIDNTFSDIVARLNSQDIVSKTIQFAYDSWIELIKEIVNKGKSTANKFYKYPLIFVLSDYKETKNIGFNKVEIDELKVYIICESKLALNTKQRYDYNYQSILKPIYDAFILEMKKGSTFQKINWNLENEAKDMPRLFVSNTTVNQLPDHLDGLEISFKNLIYINKK